MNFNKDKNKNIINVSRFLMFLTIIIFSGTYGFAAQISFMSGDVKIIKNGKARAAQFQMKLDTGDTLKTGKGAFADVSYEDGSVIKVQENSSVIIGNKNEKKSDAVSVTSGIISAKFTKLEKNSVRKVYTPTSVAAVRGTEFEVAVSESADSRVQMLQGELDVLNQYGDMKIEGDQGAEIDIGKAPEKAEEGGLNEWKDQNEGELENNPDEQADDFSRYVKDFQERNNKASKDITGLQKNQGTVIKGGKEKLEESSEDLQGVEDNVKDDMYLNAAANKSIDGILERFRKDKKGIYDNFLKIKKESNKVLEQQQRNFAAISAVKEAYKKAYDAIMKKHQSEVEKIKSGFNKEAVKPKK